LQLFDVIKCVEMGLVATHAGFLSLRAQGYVKSSVSCLCVRSSTFSWPEKWGVNDENHCDLYGQSQRKSVTFTCKQMGVSSQLGDKLLKHIERNFVIELRRIQ
jgi:hypothetical protein